MNSLTEFNVSMKDDELAKTGHSRQRRIRHRMTRQSAYCGGMTWQPSKWTVNKVDFFRQVWESARWTAAQIGSRDDTVDNPIVCSFFLFNVFDSKLQTGRRGRAGRCTAVRSSSWVWASCSCCASGRSYRTDPSSSTRCGPSWAPSAYPSKSWSRTCRWLCWSTPPSVVSRPTTWTRPSTFSSCSIRYAPNERRRWKSVERTRHRHRIALTTFSTVFFRLRYFAVVDTDRARRRAHRSWAHRQGGESRRRRGRIRQRPLQPNRRRGRL